MDVDESFGSDGEINYASNFGTLTPTLTLPQPYPCRPAGENVTLQGFLGGLRPHIRQYGFCELERIRGCRPGEP